MNNSKMTIPVYFPFTNIQPAVADMLFSCFRKNTIYALSRENLDNHTKEWSKAGLLDIRIPLEMEMSKISKIYKDYQSWASMHQGSGPAYIKHLKDDAPFYDDVATSKILKDIKMKGNFTAYMDHQEDLRLLSTDTGANVGLFLYIAERYDSQIEDMADTLCRFEKLEENFLSSLREEDDRLFRNVISDTVNIPTDYGEFMTTERIKSWVWLMDHDAEIPNIFITSSPSVVTWLSDQYGAFEKVLQLYSIQKSIHEDTSYDHRQKWHDHFDDYLQLLLEGKMSDVPHPPDGIPVNSDRIQPFSLTLYLASGKTPYAFFNDVAGLPTFLKDRQSGKSLEKNTLVGLICAESPLK